MRWLLMLAAGCGRIGFTSADLAPGDGASDSPGDGAGEVQPLTRGCDVAHPGVLLCDGFELVDDAWDYQIEDFGTVGRSELRGAQGAASLEASIQMIDQYKAARWGKNAVLPFLSSGDLYLREYLFLPSSTQVVDQLSIMVTGNMVDPFPSANVLLTPGELHAVVNSSSAGVPFEFPRDRWVCVELQIDIAVTGGMAVTIDGVTVVKRSFVDTRVDGGYSNVDVGFHYATPAQPAATMFVDEVVADTAAIGCD